MVDDHTLVPAVFDERCDDILRVRRDADVYLIRSQPEQSRRPCPAAVAVGNHLSLVYDGNIVVGVYVRHLDSRGLKSGARHDLAFLAG